jgi:hypothetical protein
MQEKTVGGRHPDVAAALANYADLLRKVHRKAESRQLLTRAHQIDSQNDHQRSMQYTVGFQDLAAGSTKRRRP